MNSTKSQVKSQMLARVSAHSNGIMALLLLGFGLLIYVPSLTNSFVLDDEGQIVTNELIQSPSNLPLFFATSTMHAAGAAMSGIYYKPIMSVCFSLLWWISPGESWPFHLFQLLLVIANAFLFYSLLAQSVATPIASAAALMYLVHPLNSEVVVYIADLQDVLYTFFGLLALNLLVASSALRLRDLVLFFILLLGSLMSKETGVLYLIICVLFATFFKPGRRGRVILTAFTSGAVYLYMRIGVAHLDSLYHRHNQIARASGAERLLTAPMAIGSYLWKFVFPAKLTTTQDWIISTATWTDFWLPLVLVSAVLFVSLFLTYQLRRDKRAGPWFAFFTFWVFMGMGFHSQILMALDGTLADRWFYFPCLGLLAMVAILCDYYQLLKWRKTMIAIFGTVVLAFSIRSWSRSEDWVNNFTLCQHDVKLAPYNYDLHNNLGVELFRLGRFGEAKAEFERSVELSPGWDISWNNLGAVHNRLGDLKKAEESYLRSMANGNYYLAYENYAGLLVAEGRLDEAKRFIVEEAIPRFPASHLLKDIYASIPNH